MDLSGQQFLAGTGLAADQHRHRLRCQVLQGIAQLLRTRVDEHQRLGADAQWAFVLLGEGQQRLTESVVDGHDALPPEAAAGRASWCT